mgnify:CR=1 FL=1
MKKPVLNSKHRLGYVSDQVPGGAGLMLCLWGRFSVCRFGGHRLDFVHIGRLGHFGINSSDFLGCFFNGLFNCFLCCYFRCYFSYLIDCFFNNLCGCFFDGLHCDFFSFFLLACGFQFLLVSRPADTQNLVKVAFGHKPSPSGD